METDKTPLRRTKSVLLKALCDILRPVVSDLVVLDLFAGSGRVGRALLGEGARRVFAVDLRSETTPRENVDWYCQEVESFLKFGPPEPVGLVFMDPPYDSGYPERILKQLAEVSWLEDNAIIAIETRANHPPLPGVVDDKFYLMRCRRYGGSKLWIYQAGRKEPVTEELQG